MASTHAWPRPGRSSSRTPRTSHGRWRGPSTIWTADATSSSTCPRSSGSTARAPCCWRVSSTGSRPAALRTRCIEAHNPHAARLITLYRGHPTDVRPGGMATMGPFARLGAVAAGVPATLIRRARFRRPFRGRNPGGHRLAALGGLAVAAQADAGHRRGRAVGHERGQPAGRPHHRVSRRVTARALRRGRLRARARGRRAVPRARPAGDGDRRRRPLGRGPRLGDRHDEGVGGDRRPAVDGLRPDAMAGRAAVSRACRRGAPAHLDRRRAGPRSAGCSPRPRSPT